LQIRAKNKLETPCKNPTSNLRNKGLNQSHKNKKGPEKGQSPNKKKITSTAKTRKKSKEYIRVEPYLNITF
jgi:hypothetical protein